MITRASLKSADPPLVERVGPLLSLFTLTKIPRNDSRFSHKNETTEGLYKSRRTQRPNHVLKIHYSYTCVDCITTENGAIIRISNRFHITKAQGHIHDC